MSVLIIYSTTHGTTEKAVNHMANELSSVTDLVNIHKTKKTPDLTSYDTIIIATSIHMGTIPKKMTRFLSTNEDVLLTKKIGLFLSCMREGEERQAQFRAVFQEKLRNHAVAIGLGGGELLISKMTFLQKMIIKKVEGTTADRSALDKQALDLFIKELNQADSHPSSKPLTNV
ncbi:flavodoxin domain-containing protein [Salipaludibacillus sp. LMS25]|jgi:menaquinone-dependent protoporphyrinogen oxidase|uniref:flavodoxin domain-containing protein n=1 Tax=Salipaludibacillus sp. LMS25 TaxID=2924031 RepID=UPI0020D08C96|nr:flavodoxin domain-containing protein [Salipaludibacillus sp. LMS25]UTR14773.1 flavodoxin domain-containing protein [Salipaludibacillus sp. LMS25]